MRWIALAMAVAICGCAEIPAYLVQPQDLHASVAPATCERDGQPVKLRGGSFMPTGEPPLPDGRVRVRGPGRHGTLWKAGLGVTVIGWTLAITGAALGIVGFGGDVCSDFHSCGNAGAQRMFLSGVVIGPVGDAMTLIGPALMAAGARQKPAEVE